MTIVGICDMQSGTMETEKIKSRSIRLIPRLDIKGPNLIKGIRLEGLRVIGSPNDYALDYYQQGADELIYMDCVASLYGRNHLGEIVSAAAKDIFVPITVGGGIRSVDDATQVLRSGADKVAVNTAAIAEPKLITDIARRFGSQCMVLSVEAKQINDDEWEAYTDNGRERTGLNVVDWIKRAVSLGAGEVLITSVDREGTRKGLDIALLDAVASEVQVPVIASGGVGTIIDAVSALKNTKIDAIAFADILHYKRATIGEIRTTVLVEGFDVRNYERA